MTDERKQAEEILIEKEILYKYEGELRFNEDIILRGFVRIFTEALEAYSSLKVAEMPTEVTDDEIAAMALEFAPVCIYGDDDDCEDVNGSIREDVTKLLKQLRNRMSKPNNCTGGEG